MARVTAGRVWLLASMAILAVVILDVSLVPAEHAGVTTVIFSVAMVVVASIFSRDAARSCKSFE